MQAVRCLSSAGPAAVGLRFDIPSLQPIAEPTVLRFRAQTGELIAAWGAHQFAMPHGLSVDHQGNIWVTDVALHQVFKLDSQGRPLLTLGQRAVPGSDSVYFNRPTDVAQTPNGSVYVSDGYRNTRVIEFDATGRFVREWGQPGTAPGQFNVPHGIAVDSGGRVYVADRGNARLQVFDSTGRFLEEWRSASLGRPWAVRIGPDGFIYVVDGGDQPEHGPASRTTLSSTAPGRSWRNSAPSGTTMGSLSGRIASRWRLTGASTWAMSVVASGCRSLCQLAGCSGPPNSRLQLTGASVSVERRV